MDDNTASSGNALPVKLTAEAAIQFQEGIDLLFSRWTALQMAVQNEWVAPILTSGLGKSASTSSISSLSLKIAEKLMLMHEECLEGNFSSIQRLRETNPRRSAVCNVGQIVDNSDDDEEDDNNDNDEHMADDGSSEMVIDVNPSHSIPNRRKPMIDESKPNQSAEAQDGWTEVRSRRNKGRRN